MACPYAAKDDQAKRTKTGFCVILRKICVILRNFRFYWRRSGCMLALCNPSSAAPSRLRLPKPGQSSGRTVEKRFGQKRMKWPRQPSLSQRHHGCRSPMTMSARTTISILMKPTRRRMMNKALGCWMTFYPLYLTPNRLACRMKKGDCLWNKTNQLYLS